ncbi:hypothetical protein B0T20DRAFT_505532 [Sordaria brevicollis]|uniref:AAA+ ATPase domain-containing protein n=1 Tax=Sordaria brevicollis TaxID=83679 RepID=A0AAE0UCY9_SORBR|nr:hypothetical protein B0T20DRAFT_505532 [Sordaria brevicollis]
MATTLDVISPEIPAAGNPLDAKSSVMEVKEKTLLGATLPEKEADPKGSAPHEVKTAVAEDKPQAKDDSSDAKKSDSEGEEDSTEQKSNDGEEKKDDDETVEPNPYDVYPPEPEDLTLEDLVPEYRCMNFEQFKNFYEKEDMVNIIHALKGPPSLHSQIQKETQRRVGNQVRTEAEEEAARKKMVDWNGTDMLHRVRIHSPCIMKHLYRVVGKDPDFSYPMRPQTFCRPFRILVHYHSEMKKALEDLEGRLGVSPGVVEDDSDTAGRDPKSKASDASDTKEASKNYLDSKEALLHMMEYVRFMELESSTVTFTDLWYLYREGDMVYSPVPTGKGWSSANVSTNSSSSDLEASYQTCWIVYAVITPETPADPDSLQVIQPGYNDGMGRSDADAYDEDRTTRICCYYLDFDGESYAPVTHQFVIRSFSGERDVTTLPVYPTHFMGSDQEARFLKERSENGLKFAEFIKMKHLYHRGWTLTRGPVGAVLDENNKYPEHVESEVIVDFDEAFQSFPAWEPGFHVPKIVQEADLWGYDATDAMSIPTWLWNKPSTSHRYAYIVLHRTDNIAHIRRNKYLESDPFLTALRNGAHGNDAIPSEKYLQLLPRRLIVFALLARKFVNACVNSLGRISPQNGIFDKLSIDPRNKSMVRSLVHEHFRKKAHRDRGNHVVYQDLVRGKGTGLVFLLHGVPGVGKTATAEAVAQEHKKPLFAITCGDLGFEPGAVEKSLTRIFRLANRWDCILLLDEAEIFFTKRSPSDLQRNALVSGIGILFLTTNRVGTLDEAFKSRIHVSLKYPPLSRAQYEAVFRVNIDKIKEIEEKSEGCDRLVIDDQDILSWARNHYDTNKEYVGRWNGRQIRNAFLIGSSLAHYDMSEGARPEMAVPNKRHGMLDGTQFEAVAQTTLSFDMYLAETRGKDDGDLAADAKSRGHMKAPMVPVERQPPGPFGHQYMQANGSVGFNSMSHGPMNHGHNPASGFGYQHDFLLAQHQPQQQQWQTHSYPQSHDGGPTMAPSYYSSPAVPSEPAAPVPSWRKQPQEAQAPATDDAPAPSWRKPQQPSVQSLPPRGHDTPPPGIVRQRSYLGHGGPPPQTGPGAGYGGYDGGAYQQYR